MQLTELAGSFGAVVVVLAAQVALASAFAVFVVFRFCGRDYDAAVIAAGYSGLGLGATPVGVANMDAVPHCTVTSTCTLTYSATMSTRPPPRMAGVT